MRIGIAGLGKMGSAMAARLHETGEDVTVWNRSRAKAEASAAGLGGRDCADMPAYWAKKADR